MDGTLASKRADSRMRIKKWDKFSRESDFWLSIYSVMKMKFSTNKIYYNFSHENPKNKSI